MRGYAEFHVFSCGIRGRTRVTSQPEPGPVAAPALYSMWKRANRLVLLEQEY